MRDRHCFVAPEIFKTPSDVEGPDGKCPWCRPFPKGTLTQAPDAKWSGHGGKDKPMKGVYKAPGNVGDAFYKALRKAGYQREGTEGDYQ